MPQIRKSTGFLQLSRIIMIAFLDALLITTSGFIAIWLRFDTSFQAIERQFLDELVRFTPYSVVTLIALYAVFKLYRGLWKFASVGELSRIVYAYIAAIPVFLAEILIFNFHLPRSVHLISYMLDFIWCVAVRFSYRIVRFYLNRRKNAGLPEGDRVMVIGAGSAGRELIRDISTNVTERYLVVCIIDDDESIKGRYLGNIPIAGTREDIAACAMRYEVDRIIFAIPTASKKDRADILEICRKTGCRVQVIPSMSQLVNGEVSVSRLKDVDVADLLGRDEVRVDDDGIVSELMGRTVLVTGGGGSIGSELCRQIAQAAPARLIIFDIYENNAYAIQQELAISHPDLDVVALIGSVRNTSRVNDMLEKYRPEIVYHAAAHKHVPLMETSPCEAIKNNCLGTYKLAKAAAERSVSRFLLISTDKAVNPTNVMGASKRICEMIIQMMDRKYTSTTFCAVRFGNVLGSNGSVIPLFRKQIEAGGPVTVTDKRIIRYFMTIPEAVSLVLQASIYADGGEIFVLDMGEPVKIDDMARRMIELSGFVPDEDIDIVYTGLRPGEKLYEELLIDRERMRRTANDMIFVEEPYPMDDRMFLGKLKTLGQAAKTESGDSVIRGLIKDMVPTYVPDERG